MPKELKLMDLSTGHVSDQTRQMMMHFGEDGTHGIANRSGGWFLPASRELLDLAAEKNSFIPSDLKLCLEYAIANEFEYVLFDQDADADPMLPFYEINSPEYLPEYLSHAVVEDYTLGATVVDPDKVVKEDLKVSEPKVLPDADFILEDGAFFTVGNALVRISNQRRDELAVKIYVAGYEDQQALTENVIPKHIIDAQLEVYQNQVNDEPDEPGF